MSDKYTMDDFITDVEKHGLPNRDIKKNGILIGVGWSPDARGVGKGEPQNTDTRLVMTLGIATVVAGFGYLAYGGDAKMFPIRCLKLIALGATGYLAHCVT